MRIRIRARAIAGGLAIGALAASGTATAAPLTSTAAAALPTFGRGVTLGVQGFGFEPNIRIDGLGRIFASVPDTAASGTSFIWRSLDGGQTFKWVPAAAPLTGKLPTCIGGGDTELAVDTANNLYFNDLTLANFSTARSGDGGVTFTPPNCVSAPSTPDDRQWYATDGDPTNGGTVVLAYNIAYSLAPGPACSTSNQLVIARSPGPGDVTGQTAGVTFGPTQGLTAVGSCDENLMGADEIHVYGTKHKVFVPHDNISLTDIRVARCDIVDFTVSVTGFTNCDDKVVSSFPNARTGANFPVTTIDRAGNIYVVWEQAPSLPASTSTVPDPNCITGTFGLTGLPGSMGPCGTIRGDCVLMMSFSTDQGDTWSTPSQIPTPGLHNNVYAWPAAGDAGRLDIAWYGTPSVQDPTAGFGPTGAEGDWGLYFAQSLDGGRTWTPPILATEHFIPRGHIFTLQGLGNDPNPLGPSLDIQRTATGDFMQMRIGPQGEANIVYTDSNHATELLGHAMFVRQNGGSSVFAAPAKAQVNGTPAATNSVTAPAGNASFDQGPVSSGNLPNLDILGSSVSMPNPHTYRIKMTVADLTSLAPSALAGGPDYVWLTQWQVPEGRIKDGSAPNSNGGHDYFAYMESTNGGTPSFYDGENAFVTDGGTTLRTYPGTNTITGSYTATAPGVITIDVPVADVPVTNPIDHTLYGVTASTMTLPLPANTAVAANSLPSIGLGVGVPFNLIDSSPAYDFIPGVAPAVGGSPTPAAVPSRAPLPNTSGPGYGAPAGLLLLLAALVAMGLVVALRGRRTA
ncbi:MAG TPA: sialidase family protein [Candidatus Dormibacteraeota bacterium]|nr:sialidase family protein [Candidatus Dormibacteraeota bacterium]